MDVRKRDGRVESFDYDKIVDSVKKAAIAVEYQDEDMQRKIEEVRKLKRKLMDAGYKPAEADDYIEAEFDGYVEDWDYTEYDEDEAEAVADLVEEYLDDLDMDVIESELIQSVVEKALMIQGHAKTAKEYILNSSKRNSIRDMNTRLMRIYEDITFGKSQDVELKRENANIDGDTAMGTMLRYGSEGAKQFNQAHMVTPNIADAHKNGDIHIHDLDFLSLTMTCVTADTNVTIKDGEGKMSNNRADYFDKYLEGKPDSTVVKLNDLEIISKGALVKLINCVRHPVGNKRVLNIRTKDGELNLTDDHVLPVNGDDKEAKHIRVGDSLVFGSNQRDSVVEQITEIEYEGYVYDFETENNYFSANGFTVHNCCQIDLEKLFNGGFNTGHGFLREPGEIRSYSALAAIAIQSNQNDMHGGQSIPAFDHYMAPGVAKTFIKKLKSITDIKYNDNAEIISQLEEIYQQLKNYRKEHRLIMDDAGFNFIRNSYRKCLSEYEVENLLDMATQLTEKDTYQAMEAFIHNLNSMHCLPYSEKIWVHDLVTGDTTSMEIGKLVDGFVPNRYMAITLNKKTGKMELRRILAGEKKDNNRRLVEIVGKAGNKVKVTDNHKTMTIENGRITEKNPEELDVIISPRGSEIEPISTEIDIRGYGRVRKDSPFKGNSLPVTEEFAELMGYYVADGSLLGNTGTICFTTCGKVSKERLDELMENVIGQGLSTNTTDYEHSSGETRLKDVRYGISSRLARMIADKFGKGSRDRKIPTEILFAEENIRKAFLKAYFTCDGRSGANYSEAGTVSKDLRDGINLLILMGGGLPTYSERTTSTEFNDECVMYNLGVGGYDSVRTGIKSETGAKFEIPKYNLQYIKETAPEEYKKYCSRNRENMRYEELDEMLSNKGIEELKFTQNIHVTDVAELNISNSEDEYVYDITVEGNENFLTAEGIYVHNSRAGSQVPFSSINFGTDTSTEGRIATKYILKATEDGLGNGETPIFPISIFKLKREINLDKDSPNYDLFKYACKVSAKRLFPNFSNIDAPYNLQYYKEGVIGSEVAYMGCVQQDEIINYKVNNEQFIEGIGRAYRRIAEAYRKRNYGISEYVDTSELDIKVYDSHNGGYVQVNKFIQNPNKNNWVRIKTDNGRSLVATLDHPLPVEGRGRVEVRDIQVGDRLYLADKETLKENELVGNETVVEIGNTVQITSIEPIELDENSYDLETASDRFDVSGLMSHNCRTRVMSNIHDPEREIVTGRGNLSFTSINLPRLALIAGEGNEEKFFRLLFDRMSLVRKQLLERLDIQSRKKPLNFPFLMGQGVWMDSEKLGAYDDISEILKHGTLTVGFIGLAETLVALTGKHHGESEESQELGLRIIGKMREITDQWTQEDKLNWSIIGTPRVGTRYCRTALILQ